MYSALKEQIDNKDETRELVYRVYLEALDYNYKKLLPHHKAICELVFSEFQKKETEHENIHFYTPAYDEEEIENLYKPDQLSKAIKQVVALSYLLSNDAMRRKKKAKI